MSDYYDALIVQRGADVAIRLIADEARKLREENASLRVLLDGALKSMRAVIPALEAGGFDATAVGVEQTIDAIHRCIPDGEPGSPSSPIQPS